MIFLQSLLLIATIYTHVYRHVKHGFSNTISETRHVPELIIVQKQQQHLISVISHSIIIYRITDEGGYY